MLQSYSIEINEFGNGTIIQGNGISSYLATAVYTECPYKDIQEGKFIIKPGLFGRLKPLTPGHIHQINFERNLIQLEITFKYSDRIAFDGGFDFINHDMIFSSNYETDYKTIVCGRLSQLFEYTDALNPVLDIILKIQGHIFGIHINPNQDYGDLILDSFQINKIDYKRYSPEQIFALQSEGLYLYTDISKSDKKALKNTQKYLKS
jgi:hypothetical protein